MDNETKKLLNFIEKMGPQNLALFQAIMMLDASPSGKRLRMIRNIEKFIMESKLNERTRREERIGQLNKYHEEEQERLEQESKAKRKARRKQQKEDSGA